MAITAGICQSYKREVLNGVHTGAHAYKIALFTSAAALDATTTAYAATNEVVGQGYTAGGAALTGFSVSGTGVARLDFTTPSWANATITARGALIYNSSAANAAVMVLDFGMDVTSTNGAFTVTMPAVGDTTSLIRFS